MENMDTNTDYQKFVRVGEQKWRIVKITIGIIFLLLLKICIHYFFIPGVFKSHLEKNHSHLKCQFPPKIPIWPKFLLYKRYEKWLSPHHPGRGCELCLLMHFETFNCCITSSQRSSGRFKHLRWKFL